MVGKAEVLLRKFAQSGSNPAAARDNKGWTALHLVSVRGSRKDGRRRDRGAARRREMHVYCACTPGGAQVHKRVTNTCRVAHRVLRRAEGVANLFADCRFVSIMLLPRRMRADREYVSA